MKSTLPKNEDQELQRQIDDAGLQQLSRGDSRAEENLAAGVIEKARSQYHRCLVLNDSSTVRCHGGQTGDQKGHRWAQG